MDTGHHCIDIPQDFLIGESLNENAFVRQINFLVLVFQLSHRMIMDTAIQFYDILDNMAVEINDIAGHWMLPSKLISHLISSQTRP